MFDTLIGNGHIKSTLRRLISTGRVPNSLLFAGDDGVGKRQFALQLASAMVCISPVDSDACGRCGACRRLLSFPLPASEKKDDYKKVFFSEHPDVGMLVPFGRNLLVDAVRDLEAEANFRPYEAAARIFLIEAADKMNDNAANALLKTLEEPPATSHIFLITSRPDSLLATIRSRCQTLRFAPVAASEIESYLNKVGDVPSAKAALTARLAHGSVGRALEMDIDKLSERRERLLSGLRSGIADGDIASLLGSSEEINDAKNKDTFEESIEIMQTLLHDLWLLKLGSGRDGVVNIDIVGELDELAARAEAARLAAAVTAIEELRGNLVVNINRRVATDALFSSIAAG